jgi:hypothetical protein
MNNYIVTWAVSRKRVGKCVANQVGAEHVSMDTKTKSGKSVKAGPLLRDWHESSRVESYVRPTVSRPVCLGIKHPSEAYDQIFIAVRHLRICWCGPLSVMRGRVCRLQLLLDSPAQSFSSPSPVGLATSLCVASYGSQDYGGGIRPRLHTGIVILL